MALQYGIVAKAGAWYRIMTEEGEIKIDNEGTQLSFQGMAKFLNYLVAHEDEVQDLLDRLDKVMM